MQIPVIEELNIFYDFSKKKIYKYNAEKDCYEKFVYNERGGTIVCRRNT